MFSSIFKFIKSMTSIYSFFFIITLTACRTAPVDAELTLTSPTTVNIYEESGAGQIIYTATTLDNDGVIFTLSGTDSSAFTINESTGEVTLIGNPNYESKSSYVFTVTATNSSDESASITVTLFINEIFGSTNTPTITSGNMITINEGGGIDQLIYTLTTLNNSQMVYTLSGSDSAAFTINETTGEVRLIDEPDYETKNTYSFTATATNIINKSASISVTLSVNDIAMPIITSGSTSTINDNSGSGQVIYTLTTSNTNEITYTLSGTDSSAFTINETTGEVTLVNDPDYSSKSSYDFIAIATNSIGESASTDVTLSVNNITLSPFNLSTITALNSGLKNITFTWSSAATLPTQIVTYSVCEKDLMQSNNCKVLGTVVDALTIDITVDNLINAVLVDYFILASSSSETLASSEQNLNTDEAFKLINYFKASNTGILDRFGYSVAISGDGNLLAVGAPNEDNGATGIITNNSEISDTGTSSDSGAVYLFTRENGLWVQSAYIKASNTNEDDFFGAAVSLSDDGNTLAVAALVEDSVVAESGAIYLFNNNGTSWQQVALLKASNPGSGDEFGDNIILSGDGNTLAVGAPKEDNSATGIITDNSETTDVSLATSSGAVYLFSNATGSWEQEAYIKASNNRSNIQFGTSVGISYDGTTLAIGAYVESNDKTGIITDGSEVIDANTNASLSGAVYLFNKNSNNWSQTAYIKSSISQAGDFFGFSVSLSHDGNTMAVGARRVHPPETLDSNSGYVFIFNNTGGSWSETFRLKHSNSGVDDEFGYNVKLSGNGKTLAVAAYYEDNSATGIIVDGSETVDVGTASNSGAVYLFNYINNNWEQSAYIKAVNTEATDYFSNIILNKDGNVLAVGAPSEDNGAKGVVNSSSQITESSTSINTGAVYVY